MPHIAPLSNASRLLPGTNDSKLPDRGKVEEFAILIRRFQRIE